MPAPPVPACLAAAVEYVRRGWSALPLCPPDHADVPGAHEQTCTCPGKRPVWDEKPYTQRLARPEQLKLLWARNRHLNVGIVLGSVSGLIGLDIEGSAGEQRLAELAGGDLPATLEFTTPGGGRRLLYRWPDLPLAAAAEAIMKEPVRILGGGSLTVMPPSRHQFGGSYAWIPGHGPGDLEPPPCPRWLLDLLAGDKTPRRPPDEPCPVPSRPAARPPAVALSPCVSFAGLANRSVAWLWPVWVPLGKLTLLDGDPGLGKSTLLLDLAARVSQRGLMPDGSRGVSGQVLILSAEDGAEDTIRPRLEACGADLDRVHALSHVLERGSERCLEIPRDLPLLEQQVAAVDARLLIVDPLAAFLCGRDANKDQAIRRVLYQLSRIAERRRCAIVCMRHLNKSARGKALYRGNMSIGVIGHARAGLLVAPDPDDAASRILAVTKCNLAAPPASLRFRLVAREGTGACGIVWSGPSVYDADQLLQAPASDEDREAQAEAVTKQALAATLLGELLARGPVEIQRLKKECVAAGLSGRTVERAARRLGLRLNHVVVEGRNVYRWSLP